MALYLGVDWGTHSSKWASRSDTDTPVIGDIWDSSVCRINDRLHMFTLDERLQDFNRETALKRKLIQDPDQPFWEGTRQKLGVTLGDAVVVSILMLLFDAKKTLLSRGKVLGQDGSVIRFSHPNWISEDNVRALQCFRDAAVVATSIFLAGIKHQFGVREISVAADDLRGAVSQHRPMHSELPTFPRRYGYREYAACSRGTFDGTTWELIFESCAAGFPYLVEGERETFEEELRTFPASQRIRKILVVDVGAGSTDAGYMVRTIRPRDSKGIMKPLLIWVPAMNAVEVAGQRLTDESFADIRQQRPLLTRVEAEDFKITNKNWYDKPYARNWRTVICDHVGEYVRGIRDDICLLNKPELEVVLTGGSSVVVPLRAELLGRVKSALRDRGLGPGFSEATRSIDVASSQPLGRSYREVEVAQLAVSLGASDPLLAELKAYPDGLVQSQFAATI